MYIYSYLLCIGFLQQTAPEFICFGWFHKEQLPINGGKPVINHNVYPLAVLPQLQKARLINSLCTVWALCTVPELNWG